MSSDFRAEVVGVRRAVVAHRKTLPEVMIGMLSDWSYRRCAWLVLWGASVLASGCGSDAPDLAPAGGTVTHDGAPLADADVLFVPEAGGPVSAGRTGADGKFRLSTSGQPGASLGKHKVSVQAVSESSQTNAVNEAGEFLGARKSRIPETYSNYEMSGLSAEVTADGENDFTFELTGSQ